MRRFLHYHSTWRYFINLVGRDFPLRTNRELVNCRRIHDGENASKQRAAKNGMHSASSPRLSTRHCPHLLLSAVQRRHCCSAYRPGQLSDNCCVGCAVRTTFIPLSAAFRWRSADYRDISYLCGRKIFGRWLPWIQSCQLPKKPVTTGDVTKWLVP